jgi:hypothetical protein
VFEPSADVKQIKEWALADPYHFHQGQAEWWLGEGSLLTFCLTDTKGPLTYVRLDVEGEYVRIHTQFAPLSVVSKRRLVAGMIEAVEILIVYYRELSKKGLVFNSVNPSLVAFMSKYLGFKSVGQNDYRLDFEETK